MDSLNSDITFKILDHLGSQDLISYSQVNQISKQRVMEYVEHQLQKKEVGLKAVLLHLDTVPKETWSRLEFRLKVEEKRQKKVPKDLFTAIKKLGSLQEVLQAQKQIVHKKLPIDIHFYSELMTQRPLHLVARRVNSKGLPRKVIQLSGRFRIEKLMGEITPGLFVFSLDIMVDPKTRFKVPQATIRVRIQNQYAVQQTEDWTINLMEIKNYVGPTANVNRVHRNWFKISTTMLVNAKGSVVYGVLFNTLIQRRRIYIDSITISRV